MSISMWLRTSRIRRGLAASAIVLAAGGLVLFRAPTGGGLPTISPAIASPSSINSVSFSGPGIHGTIALSNGKVLAGGSQLFAEVHLVADKAEQAPRHAPLALVVVLDTSGSMSGEKMDQAKDSCVKLIRDMDANDEIAFIRYSDDAEVIQSLARVGTVRESLMARVRGLTAGGGTAIPRGLSQGLSALASTHGERIRRVVLVSDGLDSTRAEAERLASDSFERGITISSMGIGLDFDESYMGGVARSGHGNFGFVKDGAALATFLHRELDETANTIVENATVRVKLPKGVTFTRASGADAKTVGDGNEVELKFGSLFAGDEQRALVELSTYLSPGETRGIEGHAAWHRVGGDDANVAFSPLQIVATSDAQSVESGRDTSVLASVASVLASRRQMEATEAYNRGDTVTAQALIDKNIFDLRTAASAAPAPAKAALAEQMKDYGDTKNDFGSAKPSSDMGKVAAKQAFAKESANMARSVRK